MLRPKSKGRVVEGLTSDLLRIWVFIGHAFHSSLPQSLGLLAGVLERFLVLIYLYRATVRGCHRNHPEAFDLVETLAVGQRHQGLFRS